MRNYPLHDINKAALRDTMSHGRDFTAHLFILKCDNEMLIAFRRIQRRRELLEFLGQTYRAPSYSCTPKCCGWDYSVHTRHISEDLGYSKFVGLNWRGWHHTGDENGERLAYNMASYESDLAAKYLKSDIGKVNAFYDGPYGAGQSPSAATMHLFLRRLAAHEPGLVPIVVDMLFARLYMHPYPKMHHDTPRVRMVCQHFMMFPKAFQPKVHVDGLAKAVLGRRRGDPKRRTRVVGYLKLPATYLGRP